METYLLASVLAGKKIHISRECNACGICFPVCTCIEENAKGYARVKNGGYYHFAKQQEVDLAVKRCPQRAISCQDILPKTKQEVFNHIND